jgi:outer membrane biogenesis lipoprotein LolB
VRPALRAAAAALLLIGLLLAGCAAPSVQRPSESPSVQLWRGRLALRFDDPAQN